MIGAHAKAPDPKPPEQGPLTRYALNGVVAAISALGVTGVVTVLGAGILYSRFAFAQLPAEQAVGSVGKTELIVFGAQTLIVYVVLGAAAVACLWVLDPKGKAGGRTTAGLLVIAAVEMIYVIVTTPGLAQWTRIWLAAAIVAVVLLGVAAIALVAASEGDVGCCCVAPLALMVVGVVVFVLCFHDTRLWVPLAAAVVLGVVLLRIAHITDSKFALFGFFVLISVPIFGAITATVRTRQVPSLNPVAVLRTDDSTAVCGYYVTQSGERVYLARTRLPKEGPKPERQSGRLFWVPVKSAEDVSLGPLMRLRDGQGRADDLARELLALRQEGKPPAAATERYQVTTTTKKGSTTTATTYSGTHPQPPDRAASQPSGGATQTDTAKKPACSPEWPPGPRR
jgi:hypothetical protein